MLVEARSAEDAESLHDGEARSVDDREVLIREAFADREGDLEVRGGDRLDGGGAASNCLPVALCRATPESVCDQEARLDEDMIAREQPLSRRGSAPSLDRLARIAVLLARDVRAARIVEIEERPGIFRASRLAEVSRNEPAHVLRE